MNYRQLLDALNELSAEQLEQTVTVEIDDDAYPAAIDICDVEHDFLEDGQVVILV